MARQPAITNRSVKNTESLPSPPDSSERPRPKSYGASALECLSTVATAVKATLDGIFSVNYYDSEGTHRGNRQVEIAAPLKVNVNVHAKGEYDPLQMAEEMEALAKHMIRNF
ncbi:hypothetical protein CERZMDRAFT_91148 [Cercospora zeae-maydis SCOH1-5]|uniref:Uncharacterized protein n=1 Tax=Cercospora zeae-maydis SCOH1-5 TaxID=717836 RepID=A0A6A6FA91_9PEZI|nr:hypothetical protein CERZMDRAFT_91148 [Cercospora zeae-maydis SCOH1-5]